MTYKGWADTIKESLADRIREETARKLEDVHTSIAQCEATIQKSPQEHDALIRHYEKKLEEAEAVYDEAKVEYDRLCDECGKASDRLHNLRGFKWYTQRKPLEEALNRISSRCDAQELVRRRAEQNVQNARYELRNERNNKKVHLEDLNSLLEKYKLEALRLESDAYTWTLSELMDSYPESAPTLDFGRYEQGDGVKRIEWIVLKYDSGNNRFLLLSRYLLDKKEFNSQSDPRWEHSSLRAWLNDEFLNTAFTEKEQQAIAAASVETNIHNGDQPTTDKVFLLDIFEADACLPGKEAKKAVPTAYAERYYRAMFNGYGCWWLRSRGSHEESARLIDWEGEDDYEPCIHTIAVRPALWLDLNQIASL